MSATIKFLALAAWHSLSDGRGAALLFGILITTAGPLSVTDLAMLALCSAILMRYGALRARAEIAEDEV